MLIGLATLFTLWALGRLAGISQIVHRTLRGPDADEAWADWLWRPGFVLGLIAGGWAWHQWGPAGHAEAVAASPAPLWTLIVGGLLVGWGTVLGNGCTSGHGVCGLGRRSQRSLVATLTFMATAVITVWVWRHVAHGA